MIYIYTIIKKWSVYKFKFPIAENSQIQNHNLTYDYFLTFCVRGRDAAMYMMT